MTWKLYDDLIEGVPEEVLVKDLSLGLSWSFVEAESGMGVSYTCRGGARGGVRDDLRGKPLKEVAALAKSWRFEEATLGIAALNAWYAQKERTDELGARYDDPVDLPQDIRHRLDAFEIVRPRVEAKGDARVVVVGHFPHVDRIAEYAHLVVLERNCTDVLDTPDPACEFVIPEADFVFITGVTLENKTAPRLLELANDAFVTMVGPSVVMSPALFENGVDMMAGSIVVDPDAVRYAVMSGAKLPFGKAVQMACLER